MSETMTQIGQVEDVIFLGQAVTYQGTAMKATLSGVSAEKLLEVPVEEDFQLGLSLGLALKGLRPISIFPRWNFLLLATNQIVNHLDKLQDMLGGPPPSIVIRTGIGSVSPMHPGPQHIGDYTDAFKLMCPNIEIVRLDETSMIEPEYAKAFNRTDGVSTILIEWSDFYNK